VVRAVQSSQTATDNPDASGVLQLSIGRADPAEVCGLADEIGLQVPVPVPADLPQVASLRELDPEDLQLLSELSPSTSPELLRGPLRLLELECSLESGICRRKESCRPSTCANQGQCVVSVIGESNFQEYLVSCTCQAGYTGPYCRYDR
jgi:hypothetical protein